jgi:hypothetical protein
MESEIVVYVLSRRESQRGLGRAAFCREEGHYILPETLAFSREEERYILPETLPFRCDKASAVLIIG